MSPGKAENFHYEPQKVSFRIAERRRPVFGSCFLRNLPFAYEPNHGILGELTLLLIAEAKLVIQLVVLLIFLSFCTSWSLIHFILFQFLNMRLLSFVVAGAIGQAFAIPFGTAVKILSKRQSGMDNFVKHLADQTLGWYSGEESYSK
jgi:hypothetical protein